MIRRRCNDTVTLTVDCYWWQSLCYVLSYPEPFKGQIWKKKPLKTTCQYLTVPFQSGSLIHKFLFSSVFAVLWTVDWVTIHGYLLPAVRQLQHSRISFSSIAKDHHSWKDYAIVYSDTTLIILSLLGEISPWKYFGGKLSCSPLRWSFRVVVLVVQAQMSRQKPIQRVMRAIQQQSRRIENSCSVSLSVLFY